MLEGVKVTRPGKPRRTRRARSTKRSQKSERGTRNTISKLETENSKLYFSPCSPCAPWFWRSYFVTASYARKLGKAIANIAYIAPQIYTPLCSRNLPQQPLAKRRQPRCEPDLPDNLVNPARNNFSPRTERSRFVCGIVMTKSKDVV